MRVSLFPNSFLSSKQLFYPDKVSSSDSVQFASKDKTKKEITAITPFQPDVFAPRDPALPSSSVEAQHRFAVIGDAGSGAKAQFDIARRMEKVFDKTPYGSVLVLGDNIYENGEPWLFDERIKEPYKNLTKQGVRMMPVMGNHDVRRGFDGAQRTYWGVPEHYKFTIGSAGKDVDVFAIDTTVLLPGYDKCYSDNPFLAKTKADQQMKWLEESLQASTARFKVVMGHYPVYSSGMHGNHRASTLKLRSILEPVLERNNVDAYLAGHEHHYEKSNPIKGITHFVTGAAGRVRDIFYENYPSHDRAVAFAKYHFMMFEVDEKGLHYQALSKGGRVLDEGTVQDKDTVEQNRPPVQLAFA